MKILLWKGYHDARLISHIEHVWKNNELLIACPPWMNQFEWLEFLPKAKVQYLGLWPKKYFDSHDQNGKNEIHYPDNPVLGVFTSGTSNGIPRLILYSKKNIETSLQGVLKFFELQRIRSVFCYPHAFHTFGLLLGYVMSFLKEIPLIIPDGQYSQKAHEKRLQIQEFGLLTLGAPTHFRDLLHEVEQNKVNVWPSYSCIVGGAPVSVALWRLLRDQLNIEKPSIGYGATEACPAVMHLPPGQEPKEDGEVGTVLDHLKVVLHPSKGLEFFGDSVCLAVIENQSIQFPTSIVLKDDVVKRLDGRHVFQGRLDFVLNRGGEKFSLEQLEQMIWSYLKLVVICVALPDDRLGEELGILIKGEFTDEQTVKTVEEIFDLLFTKTGRTFCKQNVRTISILPLNANGKIDRHKARIELFASPIVI